MVTTGTSQNVDVGKFIAQAFVVPTPRDVPGTYITKLGLFFRKKGSLSELKLFLMEMNNGKPDPSKVVEGSVVFLDSTKVNISETSDVETIFRFKRPVFLSSTKRYAFALQTPSSEYTLWAAGSGDKDLSSSKILGSNPALERVYYREINGTFSILENDDIKFRLYRAKFATNTNSQAVLKIKEKFDFLVTKPIETKQSLAVPLSTEDKIYKSTSTGWLDVGNIIERFPYKDNVSRGERYVYKINRTNLTSGADFSANDRFKAVKEGFGSAQYQTGVDEEGEPTTRTSFTKVQTMIADAKVEKVMDYAYHSVLPRFDIDSKPGTSVSFHTVGTKLVDSTFVKDNQEQKISVSPDFEKNFTDSPRWIPSVSNQEFGGEPLDLFVTLNTTNDYCAPVINLNNSRALLITNVLNSDEEVGDTELSAYSGNAACKYVSKVITLAENMDAEDLKIYVSAYKPVRTNIRVFARMQNVEDNHRSIADMDWIELEQVTPLDVFSSSDNPRQYREYEYQISSANKTSAGIAKYVGPNGELYEGFKKYSIKIVLTADTGYEFNPPKITDLRVIALQK